MTLISEFELIVSKINLIYEDQACQKRNGSITAYLTGKADFGAIFERLPAFAGGIEGGYEVPGVRVVLTEETVKLSVPHQFHPVNRGNKR